MKLLNTVPAFALLILFSSLAYAQQDPQWQLESLGIDELHKNGFTGKGIRIAILDNGFVNADQIDAFDHLNIVYQQDLIDNDSNVVEPCPDTRHCTHGTTVLSVIAAKSNEVIGAAPDAEYLLFRTEDDSIEKPLEEHYWARAIHIADSLGADIILSSLGYLQFDDGSSYSLQERDGKTTVASRAALNAARQGMLVVVSAGNEGPRNINVPADADSILAVGSLNQRLGLSTFSSTGPTGDGRIKPEVVALGERVYFYDETGTLITGDGSSLSTPLIAGLAACLWQAAVDCNVPVDAMFMRDAIMYSADRYGMPDKSYGHGHPNANKAFTFLTNKKLSVSVDRRMNRGEISIFPNPSSGNAFLSINDVRTPSRIYVEVFDQTGSRRLSRKEHRLHPGNNRPIPLPQMNNTGQFLVRVSDEDGRRLGGIIWVKRR